MSREVENVVEFPPKCCGAISSFQWPSMSDDEFVVMVAALEAQEDESFEKALQLHLLAKKLFRPPERKHTRRLNLFALPPDEFVFYFRFAYTDLRRLARLLGLPKKIVTESGVACNRLFAMAVLCGRLAFPQRGRQFAGLMQRGSSALRSIFYHVLQFLYDRWGPHLTELRMDRVAPRLAEFSAAYADAGSPYDSCFAMLDGSVKQVCRPQFEQRELYNGHKKFHCLGFQGLSTPDGLFLQFSGGIPGARHDMHILRESGIVPVIQEYMDGLGPAERRFMVYADKGYQNSDIIITPYRDFEMNEDREGINAEMSSVRVSVEWMFGVLMSLWKYLNTPKLLRVGTMPVTQFFIVAAHLTNLHACLYGNIVSDKFGVVTHVLEYLGIPDIPPDGDTDSDEDYLSDDDLE